MTTLFRSSKHAALYSKYRPSPPKFFIESIIKYLKTKDHGPLKQAVDIGCGSGQSTIALAPYFEKVYGLDVSDAQIECAEKERSFSNVEYKVSNCKVLPFTESSVLLTTFSQSIHWFNTSELFSEVKRILVPNGVTAAYGYWIPLPVVEHSNMNQNISELIMQELHENILGKYWDSERYIVQSHYADIDFPFKDIQRVNFVQKSETMLSDYIGYISTWSAYQKLYLEDKKRGEELLNYVENQLKKILNCNKKSEDISFELHTDFFMVMGRY